MKVVVAYRWARDAGAARVSGEGTVSWANQKRTAGDDDHAAVATALALAGSDDTVGVTIGEGDASWALARGVARAVCVSDAPLVDDDVATAASLAAGIGTVTGPEVVVIGDSEAHPGVASALAGFLGWPVVCGALNAVPADDGIEVTRKIDDREETIRLQLPVVIGVSAASAESRTPGMKELLAARKRPVTAVTLAELGTSVGSTLVVAGTRRPERTIAQIFSGDDRVDQLVAALRAEGVA